MPQAIYRQGVIASSRAILLATPPQGLAFQSAFLTKGDSHMDELLPEQLRRTVDPQTLDLHAVGPLPPGEGIVGQARAVAALRLGLNLRDGGFNIYVAGPPGIGKLTTVRSFVEEIARHQPTPADWCYVNNFDDPYQPRMLQLPAGRGRQLQQDMHALIERARRAIPTAFESDDYTAQHDTIINQLNAQRDALLGQLNQRAAQAGFALKILPYGLILVPMSKGRPLSEAEFQALPEAERLELLRRREELTESLTATMQQGRALERAAQEQLEAFDQHVAMYVVGELMDDLDARYRDLPEVAAYLSAVRQDMLSHIDLFKSSPSAAGEPSPATTTAPWLKELPFRRYMVNVLIDNSKQHGAPAVVEFNPTYANLCGRIEKETQFGTLYTDFTLIKPGTLHRANGGYLVIPAEELLRNPLSWDALKHAVRSRAIEIEDPIEHLGYLTTKSLRPQPIPLDVKVVLVGPTLLYYLLHAYDHTFPGLFKVKADFDTTMDWNEQNQQDCLRLFVSFCQQSGSRPLDAGAAARLIEHAARMAEDQTRLSTHFGALLDVIREANFWAQQAQADRISATHVQKALDEKIYRSNLIQTHIQELITRGSILIDTRSQRVGQINSLSVLSLGEHVFGRPSRVTASVGPGREGVIDIEREVELGGPIHSKGVLILSGYLAQYYARDIPLTLAARLVFEQSYEMVEGDSASAAELCALLSALANLPIRQEIAMTGSVNQHGEMQAIGGVNQKIEGFFDVCRAAGLTGAQGVIIPDSNVQNLMLREDVVAAVRAGQFHIWALHTIDEAMEVLTGIPVGVRRFDGHYPEGTLHDRIDQRLREFALCLRETARDVDT